MYSVFAPVSDRLLVVESLSGWHLGPHHVSSLINSHAVTATMLAAKRLQRELVALQKEPPQYIRARPKENDVLTWYYVVEGPKDSPYAGGFYCGKLIFPPSYPLAPPRLEGPAVSSPHTCGPVVCYVLSGPTIPLRIYRASVPFQLVPYEIRALLLTLPSRAYSSVLSRTIVTDARLTWIAALPRLRDALQHHHDDALWPICGQHPHLHEHV